MTDAQILALARVFDQEWTEHRERHRGAEKYFQNGAADMWATLYTAVAREIYHMHGKRGQLLFKNYAVQQPNNAKT